MMDNCGKYLKKARTSEEDEERAARVGNKLSSFSTTLKRFSIGEWI
jgi:hypothetical protein